MSKRIWILAVGLAFALAGPLAARQASTQTQGKPAVGVAAKSTVTATVVKVDAANRVLSLKDSKGEVVDVSVSPVVKRFNEIKVGDQLNVTYMEAVVIGVSKADSSTPLGMSVEQSVEPMKGTEKPAGVATRRIKATVAIDSLDLAKQTITVHTSAGDAETFHIQNPKNAENIKAGDKITIVYEEAIAVDVTSPAAAK